MKAISIQRLSSLQRWLAAAALALAPGLVNADDKQVRWRFIGDNLGGRATLAIGDTDEATDDLGLLFFQCREKSGSIEATGIPSEELRRAIGATVAADRYPLIEFLPSAQGQSSPLTVSYSELHEGWLYGFELSSTAAPFENFKQTGVVEFKLGETRVHVEFKVGLDAIAKFQAFCQRPTK